MAEISKAREALSRLMEGSRRYVEKKRSYPNQDAERRVEASKGQHPFAVILGCSDSRVPPEIIFDQGIGDLFVVRVAGNIVDDTVLGSIEYAVDHLGVHLVVVLGHSKCGAVQAAVKGGHAGGHVDALLTALQPALERARGQAGDNVENAVRANISITADCIKSSEPLLRRMAEQGKILVVGARYDLETGITEIFE